MSIINISQLRYKSDLQNFKSVLKKGCTSHMIDPAIIENQFAET